MSRWAKTLVPIGASFALAASGLAAIGLAATSASGCAGKGAGDGCPTLGDCGGDPTGTWVAMQSCSFPTYNRPTQSTAPAEYGVATPAASSGNWCWGLSFNPDGTVASATPTLSTSTIGATVLANGASVVNVDVVTSGTITFNADHTYLYQLTAISHNVVYIARSCLGVNGANLTCAQLAANMNTFITGGSPQYYNFACTPVGQDCNCTFDYTESMDANNSSIGDNGTWATQGNVIYHYTIEGNGNLYQASHTVREATFCVSNNGQTLQLTGYGGTPLALKAGLRTLLLTKMQPGADAGLE
jgi:hypothetical protein